MKIGSEEEVRAHSIPNWPHFPSAFRTLLRLLIQMSGQIAVGLKKGHKVDKRETRLKPGARKGVYFFLGFLLFHR